MNARLRMVLTVGVCLTAAACSNPMDNVHAPSGSQLDGVVSNIPAEPGTLVVREDDYSYTPVGAKPTGYRRYTGAPIDIHVGTTVEMFANYKKSTSSDVRVLKPVGKHSKDPNGSDVVLYDAVTPGTAAITAPGFCSDIHTIPCVPTITVTLNIS